MNLEIAIFLLAFFLLGYILGKHQGKQSGYKQGLATTPLLLRQKSLEAGFCLICGSYESDHIAEPVDEIPQHSSPNRP
ncbi:Hypothetical protein LUCI_1199 [Lucifera butyrica]|uniref:Uncharacterized protein n=1 Tax=Lucifera butyrica TaxID=1351585 RepID=A0A498RA13_9FIRM|nr:hypothetical protein [Lucifera butyrica]VBB05988.1 Hypothetical protein LUCI_1199 [Lucifera butyrica]